MVRVICLFIICFCLGILPASADVLTIPDAGQPANSPDSGVSRPTRGMTMDEVSRQFGKPKEIKDAVGDPPITRWVYDRFTVHFENKYVIHSVVHSEKTNTPQ